MSYLGSKPIAAYALVGGMDAESLISHHTGLVRKIAWHTLSRFGGSFELADLVQIGMIALIDAARRFEDRGIPFAAYVNTRVRGAMIDAYRDAATSTRSAMARQRQLRKAQKTLGDALGREPKVSEIADALGLPASTIHETMTDAEYARIIPIDECYSDDNLSFADQRSSPEDNADQQRLRALIANEIGKLNEREQTILHLFFFEEMNLDEIGLCLGVTAARVCQLKKSALDKLRGTLPMELAEIL